MEASPLGRLSAELRNVIYELSFEGHKLTIPEPGITRACRQTRTESLFMFFARPFKVDVEGSRSKPLTLATRSRSRDALAQVKLLNIASQCTMPETGARKDWGLLAEALAAAGFRKDRIEWSHKARSHVGSIGNVAQRQRDTALCELQKKYFEVEMMGLMLRPGTE